MKMKYFSYLTIGILFGIVMTKSQAISWYRIYEMFQFDSFHMYGIIGTAVMLGVIGVQLIKRLKLKDFEGNTILFPPKDRSVARYLIGGLLVLPLGIMEFRRRGVPITRTPA